MHFLQIDYRQVLHNSDPLRSLKNLQELRAQLSRVQGIVKDNEQLVTYLKNFFFTKKRELGCFGHYPQTVTGW